MGETGLVSGSAWRIDAGLAADLATALGWSPDQGVAPLARRLPERVPCGSTAKLEAMAEGRVPPGADPEALAVAILGHLGGGGGGPGPTVPSPSWTCWVLATVMAALVDTLGPAPARVAALRRIDDRSAAVDLHSAVIVDEGDHTWICDPYFGAAVPTDAAPDRGPTPWSSNAGDRSDPPARLRFAPETNGRWTLEVAFVAWPDPLRYRSLAPVLDRTDVEAVCAISVSHSGVAFRPYARLNHPAGVISANQDADGTAHVTRWAPSSGASGATTTAVQHVASWSEAAAAFAIETGSAIR